jgi:hypothetical protein
MADIYNRNGWGFKTMTLSPQEIQQVYKACEDPSHICLTMRIWTLLDEMYGFDFYFWFDESSENERIMALLFFVAAGGEL